MKIKNPDKLFQFINSSSLAKNFNQIKNHTYSILPISSILECQDVNEILNQINCICEEDIAECKSRLEKVPLIMEEHEYQEERSLEKNICSLVSLQKSCQNKGYDLNAFGNLTADIYRCLSMLDSERNDLWKKGLITEAILLGETHDQLIEKTNAISENMKKNNKGNIRREIENYKQSCNKLIKQAIPRYKDNPKVQAALQKIAIAIAITIVTLGIAIVYNYAKTGHWNFFNPKSIYKSIHNGLVQTKATIDRPIRCINLTLDG